MRVLACNVLFKIVVLFLVVMAVLAMFGKMRLPKLGLTRPSKCRACGRHLIGKGPCACGGGTGK